MLHQSKDTYKIMLPIRLTYFYDRYVTLPLNNYYIDLIGLNALFLTGYLLIQHVDFKQICVGLKPMVW